MLPAPPRTASGRRFYRAMDIRLLAFIRRSRELDFSLHEIRALIRLGDRKRLAAVRSMRLQPIISRIFEESLTT